jgi:hypothetical protein
MPTAAVVAGPEPEIAPKNILARMAENPRPPAIGPAITSAMCTSLREIPALCIKAPDNMNAGNAIIGNESTAFQAVCTSETKSSPAARYTVIAEAPKATTMGDPTINSKTNMPNNITGAVIFYPSYSVYFLAIAKMHPVL